MTLMRLLLMLGVVTIVVALREVVDAVLAFMLSATFAVGLLCLGVGTLIGMRLDRLDNEVYRDLPAAYPPLPRQRQSVEEGAW